MHFMLMLKHLYTCSMHYIDAATERAYRKIKGTLLKKIYFCV